MHIRDNLAAKSIPVFRSLKPKEIARLFWVTESSTKYLKAKFGPTRDVIRFNSLQLTLELSPDHW
jgi:hypothetical protein